MQRIREFNRRLNDRFFPRCRPRYVSCFRELTKALSFGCARVLHLGSGPVDLEPWLPAGPAKPQLLALDVSLHALTSNSGKLRICADAERLPLPSASVDLIVAEHVFEHFPRPEVCLRECFPRLTARRAFGHQRAEWKVVHRTGCAPHAPPRPRLDPRRNCLPHPLPLLHAARDATAGRRGGVRNGRSRNLCGRALLHNVSTCRSLGANRLPPAP